MCLSGLRFVETEVCSKPDCERGMGESRAEVSCAGQSTLVLSRVHSGGSGHGGRKRRALCLEGTLQDGEDG